MWCGQNREERKWLTLREERSMHRLLYLEVLQWAEMTGITMVRYWENTWLWMTIIVVWSSIYSELQNIMCKNIFLNFTIYSTSRLWNLYMTVSSEQKCVVLRPYRGIQWVQCCSPTFFKISSLMFCVRKMKVYKFEMTYVLVNSAFKCSGERAVCVTPILCDVISWEITQGHMGEGLPQ